MRSAPADIFVRLLDKRFRWLYHAVYVLFVFTFWFLYSFELIKDFSSFLQLFLFGGLCIAVVYLNVLFLFPRFFLRGKAVWYIVLTLVSYFIAYLLQQYIYAEPGASFFAPLCFTGSFISGLIVRFITYLMFMSVGIAFTVLKLWIESRQKIMRLESENLKAELNNLKSQVSPHFLFNTFNNLYVLCKTNPPVAAEMIMGLSDLMRYQLTECRKEKVPLRAELEYIRNFLELEKLRKDDLEIVLEFPRDLDDSIQIEPLLFISLVENAVKHGSQQIEQGKISVRLQLENKRLLLVVENTKPVAQPVVKKEPAGYGLENLRQRLQLGYHERYRLQTEDRGNLFFVELEMMLT